MCVRFEMVLELLIEYGEHESSLDAHMPNPWKLERGHYASKLEYLKERQEFQFTYRPIKVTEFKISVVLKLKLTTIFLDTRLSNKIPAETFPKFPS